MQAKLTDGSVIVCGTCGKDAEFKTVGEKNSRKCTVSLAVGKRQDGGGNPSTVWCNVIAWRDLASLLAPARKGDAVFVVGRLKSREYNGKTYTVGVVRPRIKDGKEEEYLANAKYYGDLASAIRGLMEFERRRITSEAHTLGELLEAVRKSDNAIFEALCVKAL